MWANAASVGVLKHYARQGLGCRLKCFSRLSVGWKLHSESTSIFTTRFGSSRRFSLRTEMGEFQQAQNAVKGLQSDPGNDTKLILYALFKQATKGDVTGDAPSMFDMVGKAKYSKWESFKGLSQEDAKVQYISIVKSLCPNGALPENVSTSTASEAISATTAPALPPTPPLLDIAYPRMSGEGTIITKLAPELESIKLSMTDNGVLRVQLNRESTGNAFNMRMWHEITQVFDTVNRDSSVKVCVLTGGAKTFSTGMDLSVFAEMNQMAEREKCPGRLREGLFSIIKYLQNAISGPEKCRVPVIAAISGNCIGGAIDLITACDMRYVVFLSSLSYPILSLSPPLSLLI